MGFVRDDGSIRLQFPHHFPGRHHVLGGLRQQDAPDLVGLHAGELVDFLLLIIDLLLGLLISLDDLLRRKRVLIWLAAVEYALQGIEVHGGNRIELMIVALGASGGEGKKCSRRYIDPVVARLRRKRQKTESGEHFFTVFAGQQIRRQLGFYEAVIRQIPVEDSMIQSR